MIRIAFVEDEISVQKMLKTYLSRYNIENGEPFSNPAFYTEAEDFLLHVSEYDFVCFDISLGEGKMNGYEAAKKVREAGSEIGIVFITNLTQYAVQGYEVSALDYILKPLNYTDFSMKMDKVKRILQRITRDFLILNFEGSQLKVSPEEILYLEVSKHYITYHLKGKDVVIRSTMKVEEEKLKPYHFYRINSYLLVNLRQISSIEGDEVDVQGKKLPISRSRKNDFLVAFARYIGGLGEQ